MLQAWNFTTIGFYIFVTVFIRSNHCSSTVKMEVTVNSKYMTLSCLVTERDPRKNVYLFCPLVANQQHCRENCKERCQEGDCKMIDSLIECREKGFNSESSVYQIDYVIDGSRPENNGKWSCHYAGYSSSVVHVNASSSKVIHPHTFFPSTKSPPVIDYRPNIDTNERLSVPTDDLISANKRSKSGPDDNVHYDKFLTKSEFIITVIGLLALSLIFNLFFCCRMIIVHCRSKKKTNGGSQYFSMHPNNRPYNHSNSQVSDPERIYEDTSIGHRQMSFLTQIKNANGNYLAPSTLSPPSGFSTMLPHHLSFHQPVSYNHTQSESGSNQINYSFLSDPTQANYASVNFPTENNYTNFVSVAPELCRRDGNNISQPVYLAFQPAHSLMATAGNRYVQYSNQVPATVAPITKESSRTEPTITASSIAIPQSGNRSVVQDDGKSNYQLSREMMEEADNLLRTADTLLRSTEDEMKFYQR